VPYKESAIARGIIGCGEKGACPSPVTKPATPRDATSGWNAAACARNISLRSTAKKLANKHLDPESKFCSYSPSLEALNRTCGTLPVAGTVATRRLATSRGPCASFARGARTTRPNA